MKGVILAGGAGTRLHPLTKVVSKQLLPIYDKPMIYYPLSVLMLAGLREILLISTPTDLPLYKSLLGDGSRLGVKFEYAEQAKPDGLAQAFIIGREFLAGSPACLVLGDNVFYGHSFIENLSAGVSLNRGAYIFAYHVRDPERYGVVDFDKDGKVLSIEEKPLKPKTNFAVPGIYFYDGRVCDMAASLKPSPRGELEITDLNRLYLEAGELRVERLGRGVAWLDTGTHRAMFEASNFVQTIEERQGLKIACLEEIAWHKGWITADQVRESAQTMGKSSYADYLWGMLKQEDKA